MVGIAMGSGAAAAYASRLAESMRPYLPTQRTHCTRNTHSAKSL